ncbi:hypothetical protein [Thalassospira sp.]|uniref:hypothetical protein n=1 Tax=Thalassospira sp. TaxID=1912094 RepID=UPI0032EF14AA
MKPILFVVGQAATAAYLLPLWRRWMREGKYREQDLAWNIVINDVVARYLERENVSDMPIILDHADLSLPEMFSTSEYCMVMSASFAPIEQKYIRRARKGNIPVARIIDTWYGYHRRLVESSEELSSGDKVLVIDEFAFQEALAEGIAQEYLEIAGQPAWESIVEKPPQNMRDILFISQPVERFYGQSLGYTEKSAWEEFRKAVSDYPNLFDKVYFAPHPDDDMQAPVHDDRVIVVTSGLQALNHVGTVVGMFSSLVTDGLLAGRRTISFQPDATGPDLCAMGRVGIITRATTTQELIKALQHRDNTHLESLKSVLVGSTDRLADFCREFIKTNMKKP